MNELPLNARRSPDMPRVWDVLLHFFGIIFGWLVLLLTLCFKLPDIQKTPFLVTCWLLGAAAIWMAYLLPVNFVAHHGLIKKSVFMIQATSICLLFPFVIYGMHFFGSGRVIIADNFDIGSSRLWFVFLSCVLLVGSVCGFIRTLVGKRL